MAGQYFFKVDDKFLPLSGGTVTGNTYIQAILSADTLNLVNTPTNNNTLTEILSRNSSTGNVEYRDVQSIISAATSQDTFVSGGTYNEGTTSIDFSGNSVETTFSVSLSGISSNIDIYNTYFVSPTGDDSTAVRGDLHNPFKTITAARNKVVAELSASTVTGDTLIHVYPGSYTEDEIQYENGNFYFEPGATINQPDRGGSLIGVFNLGAANTIQPNTYTADTCNIYGHVDINLGGGSLSVAHFMRGNSESIFEFNKINIGNGFGLVPWDNSKLFAKGVEIDGQTGQYCFRAQGNSEINLNIGKVITTSNTFGLAWKSGFNGVSYVNVDEIIAPSNQIVLFTETVGVDTDIVVDYGIIKNEYSGVTSVFLMNNYQQRGGKITYRGNISIKGNNGAVYNNGSTGGEINILGDIKSDSTAIQLTSTNTTGNTLNYVGNITTTNPNASIDLDDGSVRLDGSLNGMGGTTNGIDVSSGVNLSVGNFSIENVSGDSVTGTGSIEILNNLYIDKPLTVPTTGQYTFTGTTYDGDLNIYNTPTNDNTLTEILGRNSTTGDVEYRDVSTIAPAAKLQNTYFVSSLSGDNSTALVGDINNPWKTITGARNQAVSDGLSNSLIHVYSGEYLEDEIQYENGNFYFEPNSKVATQRTASGGTTSIFRLGQTLVYESNAYSANTCNVYGYGDFSVSATTDTDAYGGFILSMLGDSNSYFEFNDAYVHSGEAFYAGGNSILTLEGHDILLDPSGSDGLDFSDTSTTLINVNNIVGGNSHYNIHYRQYFAGKSVVNFNKLIGSDQLIAFDRFMQPTAEITMNFNLIEHTGGSQFIINSGDNLGGKVTLNGDFYAPYGNGILLFHDDGEYNINGNITCRDTALLSISALTPSNNFVLNYDGDIVTSGVTSDFNSNGGIELYKITANLNGSLTNLSLGSLSNGVNIDGDSILSIDNFDINVASGNTIGTSSSNVVNIKHSLNINKPMSSGITTTGLFNYTGTTNVGDLVIYNTPTNDNTLTQILGRNSTTGDIEYRDVSSIIPEGKLQNTYFVSSLSGDNSTALVGDINKPFETITGARNQAVADGFSNSLIYVHAGDYIDYEVQYENGNFYFEPNANVTLSASTSIFRLGTNLNIADPIYTGNTCNVYGYGNFIVPPSVPGGGINTMGLNSGLSPQSYFECNSIDIDNGVGFFLANDSKITLKCDLIKRNVGPGTTGCIRISDDSEGYINVRKIEGGTGAPAVECRWTFDSTFNGKALINVDKIETTPGCLPVFIVNAVDGSEVVLNSNKLTHTSSGSSSDYLLYNQQQRGGTIRVNANLENEGSGILYGGLGSDAGLFEFNGNIRTKYTAIDHTLTDTSTDIEIKYNGDIVVDGDATSAIVMNGSTLSLNGSLKDLNTTGTTNGVTINGTTDLKIVNFDIDVNTESIVSSVPNEIEIIHSLNVDKPLNSNITTTGLYNFTGTTNVGDLVIYNTPTNDNSLTQILSRDSSDGTVKYRSVSSIIGAASADTYVTAFTYDNANKFTISDNSGSTFNAVINTVTGLTSTGNIDILGNVIVTGGTGNVFSKQYYVEGNLGLDWDFGNSAVTLGNPVDGVIINGNNLTVNSDVQFNSGVTVDGNALIKGNVTILGSATTIDSETVLVKDNIITLNSSATGTTAPFPIDSGIEVLRNSATTASLVWEETNEYWSAGLTGSTARIILEGDGLNLLNSGHTHPISEIVDLQTELDKKFDITGGTVTGDIVATGAVSADTLNLTSLPILNNSATDILVRNSSTGEVEYKDTGTLSAQTIYNSNSIVGSQRKVGLTDLISFSGGTVDFLRTSSSGIFNNYYYNTSLKIKDYLVFGGGAREMRDSGGSSFYYINQNYSTFNIPVLIGASGIPTVGFDLDIQGDALVNGGLTANTLSGTTIYSGSTDLSDLFLTEEDNAFSTGGTVTQQATSASTEVTVQITGNDGFPSYNITGLTDTFTTGFTYSATTLTISQNDGSSIETEIDTIDLSSILSAVTFDIGTTGSISATTFYSGSTDLSDIFLTTADGNDITRVQLGTNTFTGGTDNNPTVNVTGLTVDNITVSGISDFQSISATTIYSGSTDLSDIFLTTADGNDITRVQPGININTGGTANNPIVNLDDDISLNSVSATTLSGGTIYSGSTDLSDIFLTTSENTFITGFTYNDANTFTISDNAGSAYTASISAMTGLTINGESTGTTLTVNGQSVFSGSSTDVVQIYGSGSTSPLFRVEGSSGELFSISDSLIGDLFTVNNISGLPILVVNSDNTILWGDNTVPSLNTTVKKSINSGLSEIYSIPVSAYTGGFFDYTVTGAGARAGSITSIFSGTTVQFNETTTNDIGDTSGITFDMNISGGTANLTVSATTNSWEIKTIVRSI